MIGKESSDTKGKISRRDSRENRDCSGRIYPTILWSATTAMLHAMSFENLCDESHRYLSVVEKVLFMVFTCG
jgi:hypothetical protein